MPVYVPDKVGSLWMEQKAVVYGLAYDPESSLVALSLQAPQTLVDKTHFDLQGQETRLVVSVPGESARSCYSRKNHFRVFKSPIPDTGEVSMIMLNDSLFGVVKDMSYTHVWYEDLPSFKRELYMRVKQIVYIPMKPEWTDYLYMKGSTEDSKNRRALCGRLTNRSSDNYWNCAGFDIGYIQAFREGWESIVSKGLEAGSISL